ncbi:Energy-coupling factor transporter transmembrane protein EcfT [uncultured archaeon]|nr:Energy-coupling factor transporter transmembrane protein EcfT [uncultured archaeon]
MMPEWLTRDPLNGLVITFFFFISLIMGRYISEHRTQEGERRKIIEPRIRLILAFLLIITVTLMEHWYFPAAISILCIIIAYKFKVFHDYSKYMIFPLAMAVFILAVQVFSQFTGTKELPVRSSGLEYGLLIFTRIFASSSVLIILMLSTSESEILGSLRWLRFPSTILEISSFMSRYIKTFSNEGKKLRMAQRSRLGISGSFLKKMQDNAIICGLLITRAFTRSEDVYRAMLSRGWKPELRSQETSPMRWSDMVPVILLVSGLIGIVFLDRFI